ncbi:MAG: hypothetical protein RRZ24_10510 [Clostridia bacterium]
MRQNNKATENRRIIAVIITGLMLIVAGFLIVLFHNQATNESVVVPTAPADARETPVSTNVRPSETESDQSEDGHDLPIRNYIYQKYLISPLIEQTYHPNKEVYQRVFDAVDQFVAAVDVSSNHLCNDDVENIAAAIFNRFEFEYIDKIMLSSDQDTIEITYRSDFTKQEAMESSKAFRENVIKILDFVKDAVGQDRSDFAVVYQVYQYISKNASYNPDAENLGPYGLLVNKEAICVGFAYGMNYILDQLGIENYLAQSDANAHIWNIVKMSGNYYHMDAAGESAYDKSTPTLGYFGMDDAAVALDAYYQNWYLQVGNGPKSQGFPLCTDPIFTPMIGSQRVEVNFEQDTISYTDYNEMVHTIDISKFK